MSFLRHSHWVGQRVRNKKKGWYGWVRAVECTVCGADVNEGFKCPHVGCGYTLTVAQVLKDGTAFLKPWCRAEDYEGDPAPTLWARLDQPDPWL